MNLQKHKPFRSNKYLRWVRSLPCVITGRTEGNHAHHIIACGMGGSMGTKPSDLFTIPICAEEHNNLHYGLTIGDIDQKALALKTLEKAVADGVLIMGDYRE